MNAYQGGPQSTPPSRPGWYICQYDPPGLLRWHDGYNWTAHTRTSAELDYDTRKRGNNHLIGQLLLIAIVILFIIGAAKTWH